LFHNSIAAARLQHNTIRRQTRDEKLGKKRKINGGGRRRRKKKKKRP